MTPVAPLALVYVAGLILGHFIEAPIWLTLTACFVLILPAFLSRSAGSWSLAGALILFGWLNLSIRTAQISPHDIRGIIGEGALLVTVHGRLRETPAQRVYVRDEKESWRTHAEIELETVQVRPGQVQPAHGRVLTLTSGILGPEFVEGQSIEIEGVLLRPPPPVAEGLFDYGAYLQTRGLQYVLKAESPAVWRIDGPSVPVPLTLRFQNWARRALALGMPQEDEPLRLQWAMVLGWQTAINNEVAEPFMRSGTMHIFAISGLHIALLAGIFALLLRALGLPRAVAAAIVLPLIWFYTAATGWQPSAIRSTVMMTVILAGWSLRRPSNLLNSLAAAALIILIWDPLQLFQASFQLSFFVVLSIALLVPLLDRLKERIFHLDPLIAMEVRPSWQLGAMRCGRVVWGAAATSLAAWLGSLPLIAFYFHLFTPGSLIANLLVVPVSSFALMSGLGAILAGGICPLAAALFNHSGWFFMRAMMWLSERAADLPGSWIYVRAPGVTEFLLFYALLLGLLAGWLFRGRFRYVALSVVAILGAISAAQWFAWRSAAEITVMPLTGTHSVVAREAGQGNHWLVNCGPHSSFGLFLKPVLQARGINHIKNLVLARSDSPHNSAAPDLHDTFPVGTAWVSPHKSLSAPFRAMISELNTVFPVRASATNGGVFGPWRVLHPGATDKFRRGQDYAVAMLGTFDDVRVLLLPDLGVAGQNALFNRTSDLRADIIIAGLPDAGEPLASEMIARYQPKLLIIADCEFPAIRRAGADLRQRLGKTGVPVVYTAQAGAVTLRCVKGSWRLHVTRE